MRVAIHPPDLAALILGIDVIGIGRIRKHPEAVPVVHIFPLRVGDAARVLRLAHKRAVILQTAVNAVRIFVIHANVIKLGDWQVFSFPPFRTTVVGIPHPSIVAGEHDLGVGWIDPYVVHVAVHPPESADHRETFARILADNHRAIRFKYAVGILWIDNQIREIERAPYHPLTFVSFFPAHAAIVGDEQRAIR